MQSTGEEFAVNFRLVAGTEVVMMRVENARAFGVQKLIELEELRVFVAGAVKEPEKLALVAFDFTGRLRKVVQTDKITGKAGLVERLVEQVDEVGVVLPIPCHADLVKLTGGWHGLVRWQHTSQRRRFRHRALRGTRKLYLRSCE